MVLLALGPGLCQVQADSLPPSPYEWLLRPLGPPQSLSRYLPAGFNCPQPPTPLEQRMAQATAAAGGLLGCGNIVGPLVYFPDQDFPVASAQPYPAQGRSAHGGFDVIAEHIRSAKQEVLLANMFWDDGPDFPGRAIAAAVAELRRQVQAHPEQYPHGVVVRLLLGNSLGQNGFNLDPLTSLAGALSSLQAEGVPLPGQPDEVSQFRLEVSNWRYMMPHSHMKLLVIDGKTTLVGGYNITRQHLPPGHPSGQSQNVHDLAITVTGPAARQAAAVFDDLWQYSRRVQCSLQQAPTGPHLYCPPRDINLTATHTWLSDEMPTGTQWVFPIYRRRGFDSGDQAIATLMGSAQIHLDLLQSQVSGTLGCLLTWGAQNGCIFPQDALQMWQAVIESIEQRHIHVRVLLDQDPEGFNIEGQAFLSAMHKYLKAQDLDSYFEMKYYNSGRNHTKLILVDNQMASIGSYNLHYSSQGSQGLNEYDLATAEPAIVSALQQQFDHEWSKGKTIDMPWWLD